MNINSKYPTGLITGDQVILRGVHGAVVYDKASVMVTYHTPAKTLADAIEGCGILDVLCTEDTAEMNVIRCVQKVVRAGTEADVLDALHILYEHRFLRH